MIGFSIGFVTGIPPVNFFFISESGTLEAIFEVLPDVVKENDLLLTLGAGDIGSLSLQLYETYSEAIH